MAIVVPVYEREQAGVYYNTAAVYDADGTYLGQVPEKSHPAHVRVLGEVSTSSRATSAIRSSGHGRDHRRLHLLRPPLPRGRAAPRPERRRDRVQPVGDGGRAVAVPVEARAAGTRGRQRLLHGAASTASAPRRRGTSGASTASSYFVDPRGDVPRHRRPRTRTSSWSPNSTWTHRRGAPHVAVLSRSPAGDGTARWRSRRP